MSSLFMILVLWITSGCKSNTVTETPFAFSLIDDIEISSPALNKRMNFVVYLPAGYNPEIKYPVLYILYGYGGNREFFFNAMGLNHITDQLILSKTISPTYWMKHFKEYLSFYAGEPDK